MDRFPNASYPDHPDPNGQMPAVAASETQGGQTEDAEDLHERIDADGNPTTDPSGIYVDRRDREHVAYYQDAQGRWKPTALKRGDHVICAGLPLVVLGPARDRRYFNGFYVPWFGTSLVPIEALYVSERAPADANEPQMPIIPEAP